MNSTRASTTQEPRVKEKLFIQHRKLVQPHRTHTHLLTAKVCCFCTPGFLFSPVFVQLIVVVYIFISLYCSMCTVFRSVCLNLFFFFLIFLAAFICSIFKTNYRKQHSSFHRMWYSNIITFSDRTINTNKCTNCLKTKSKREHCERKREKKLNCIPKSIVINNRNKREL